MSVKIIVPFYPLDVKGKQDYFKICADVTGGEIVPVEGKTFSQILKIAYGQDVHAHGRGFPFPEVSGCVSRRSIYTPHFNTVGHTELTKTARTFLFNKYGRVVALTEHGRRCLIKDGIKKDKIRVLPLPIDYDFYSKPEKGDNFREKFGIGNEPFVLASDARDVKNPKVIIDACRMAGVKLVYIGGTTKKEVKYVWRVPRRDILKTSDVTFTGFLRPKEVLQALDAASVFVNSSKYESFCLAAYESACASIPMCLPKIGTFDSFRDAALFHTNTDAGELANNIRKCLDDLASAKRRSKKARNIAKKFDYFRVRKLYEEFYEDAWKFPTVGL